MKAPDVIYVEFSEDVNLAFEKQPFDETPTYISKDALIEWLGGRMTIEGATEGFVGGYDTALRDVLDKLNAMEYEQP